MSKKPVMRRIRHVLIVLVNEKLWLCSTKKICHNFIYLSVIKKNVVSHYTSLNIIFAQVWFQKDFNAKPRGQELKIIMLKFSLRYVLKDTLAHKYFIKSINIFNMLQNTTTLLLVVDTYNNILLS